MNREFTDEILAQGIDSESLAEILAPHIWNWALDNKDEILERFDMEWCDICEDFVEVKYVVTHKQTHEQPEEGVLVCPECGRSIE